MKQAWVVSLSDHRVKNFTKQNIIGVCENAQVARRLAYETMTGFVQNVMTIDERASEDGRRLLAHLRSTDVMSLHEAALLMTDAFHYQLDWAGYTMHMQTVEEKLDEHHS